MKRTSNNYKDYLCNNRQCRSCKYLLSVDNINDNRPIFCYCNYMFITGMKRDCEIPFCKKYEKRKGVNVPKYLTKEDFKNYYCAYPVEG